jgi:hypothetical protein
MLDWCHANVAAGAWAEHDHQVRRKGERPVDFARWYFLSDADAEAFKKRWVPAIDRVDKLAAAPSSP